MWRTNIQQVAIRGHRCEAMIAAQTSGGLMFLAIGAVLSPRSTVHGSERDLDSLTFNL